MVDRPRLEPGEVLYEIHSKPDSLGRSSFTKHRLTHYIPGQEYDPTGRLHKGQCFRARIPTHMKASKDAGLKVRVLDRTENS